MIGKDSRYAAIPVRSRTRPDGTEVRHLRPVLLQHSEDVAVATHHRVKDSERIDLLSAQYFRQATAWWVIAAGSPRPHPDEVLGAPGDTVAIPLLGAGGVGPR
jgi:hypothetical protein